MPPLQIYDPRERALVAAADAALAVAAGVARLVRRRERPRRLSRILLLRLERIGDLLMALPAIVDVRANAPAAQIDLAVGSWNETIARAIPGLSHVHVLDAPWLARDRAGADVRSLVRQSASWRKQRYDLAINFEPDVRSNLLLAAAGARWTAGYRSGGGEALLDQALDFQPERHTTANARRLVAEVFGEDPRAGAPARLDVPAAHRAEAERRLAARPRPVVAMHVAGGRPVKQWDVERFAAVARELAAARGATLVLTGGPGDHELVRTVASRVPAGHVLDLSEERDLLTVAAILERCELMITGDTGPMHLAAAVGTPIVAVFGPSDPRRYAPGGPHDVVVRVDLPCAPCNRIRLPPARCTGHMPDCLALITPDRVLGAALEVLDACAAEPRGQLAR